MYLVDKKFAKKTPKQFLSYLQPTLNKPQRQAPKNMLVGGRR
jgi:hypothetical protein